MRQTCVLRSERACSTAGAPATSDLPPPFRPLSGPSRLECRNELVLAAADQIRATHPAQRLAKHGPIVGIVVPQESLVQPPHLETLRDDHLFARARDPFERILA